MKKIVAIIRPSRLDAVQEALAEQADIAGITVTDVRGIGRADERQVAHYRGNDYVISMAPKIKLELIATDDEVDRIVATVLEFAHTGEEGDGKIFVIPMGDVVRIRTGDRGDAAVE
jgi:nitrogen regulatory protein P-II 1